MTTPILTTKLYIPRARPQVVARPRLMQRLNAGLGRRLTLVSAQAGFGKTTLLSNWARGDALAGRVAWLSLDAGDQDPTRFMSYLVAALQTVAPELGQDLTSAFRAPQPPPAEALLTSLINQIAALPNPLVLVLDDYHVIKAPPIHAALTLLLEHLPPWPPAGRPGGGLHLALATRADPPLPLARLRGRGQLTELRQADLRFTPDEAATFLNQVMHLDLAASDVVALERRTEGWITGLQLAALSMQGRDDVAGFVRAFAGSNRYVLDYLTEEVLGRQPPSIQSFLLETAILERLTGSLCDALTGRDDGAATLATLEQANLFLVPLDEQRQWYRYHRLFADLLRARLEAAYPKRAPELHRRASAWHEEQGAVDAAVSYAVAAADWPRVETLLKVHGLAMLMSGELSTLLRWLSALPEARVNDSARLSVLHAWALLLTGQMTAVEPHLTRAERLLADGATDKKVDPLSGEIAAIRAYAAVQMGDVARTVELAQRALALLDHEQQGIRGVVLFALGGAYMLQDEFAPAGEAMAQAAQVAHQGGNIHLAVPALNALAGIQAWQGRLSQARATAQRAIHMASGPSGRPSPIAGGAVSALAELAYEANDLAAALDNAQQSLDLNRRWGNVDSLGSAYLTLAQVLTAQENFRGAQDALDEAVHIAQTRTVVPLFTKRCRAFQARLWLAQGDTAAAARWAAEVPSDTPDALRGEESIVLAQVRLALGDSAATLTRLSPLLAAARQRNLKTLVITVLALQALAYQAQGAAERAQAALAQALALAEAQGHVRTLVDLGPGIAALLRQAAQRGTLSDHGRRVLAAFETPKQAAPPPAPSPPPPLVEPLTERELEVLHLIAAGLSNREIAAKLVVAVGTVKAHTSSIYGKLGVHSRTRAVAEAKRLGIGDG
jgi:LuxR family transcriptional regulator, maltose regulon positive regulatory protein